MTPSLETYVRNSQYHVPITMTQTMLTVTYLLHHDKRDFDKTEEVYKKVLQTEPHRNI